MNSETRGSSSFHPMTRAVNKHGNPCSRLKSHFEYDTVYRSVIGWAESKAALDPERFVWIRKWTKPGKNKRQIFYCLQFFEERGLITPARRFRNAVWREGFIVASHADISEVSLDGKLCRLNMKDPATAIKRLKGRRRNPSASETISSASGISPSASRSASRNASEIGSECIWPSDKASQTRELGATVENLGVANPVNPVNPVKENPVKENPVENQEQNQPLPLSIQTFDLDSGGQGKNLTYREVLWEITPRRHAGGEYEEIIRSASSGAIEISRARKYEHAEELSQCCVDAVGELSADPWPSQNESGYARIMGRVVDFMQARSLAVPKAWIACLNDYRRRFKEGVFTLPDKTIPESFIPGVLPENIDAQVVREALLTPEAPYWYRQNGYITERELGLVLRLKREAYDTYSQVEDQEWEQIKRDSEERERRELERLHAEKHGDRLQASTVTA